MADSAVWIVADEVLQAADGIRRQSFPTTVTSVVTAFDVDAGAGTLYIHDLVGAVNAFPVTLAAQGERAGNAIELVAWDAIAADQPAFTEPDVDDTSTPTSTSTGIRE